MGARVKIKTLICTVCFIAACFRCGTKPSSQFNQTGDLGPEELQRAFALDRLELSVGMRRADLEKLVAEATGVESKYIIHTMHGQREAQYHDGKNILIVKFRSGAPAPWIKTEDGSRLHLPPIDATVESWELKKK